MSNYKFETAALHAGQIIEEGNLSRAVPVHRTTAYLFKDAEHASDLFSLKQLGYIYTRLGNPTQDVLEQRIAELEGGKAAVALASGTSAIFYAVINILSAGDEIASASNLYGGTYTMFNDILLQFGIKTNFFDVRNPEELRNVITEKTRAVFFETIGNPGLDIADIEAISKIAHEHGLPVIVDSTFTTPYLLRPIEHGADIVVHSLTKWIGGHGTAIGGVIVDSGNFDWKNEKFKLYNEPDASYHGLCFAHDLGSLSAVAFAIRLRVVPLRNLGAAISPDNSWMFLQGLETLALRMERHSENAYKVASFLENHSRVSWVKYPGLESHPDFKTAERYLKKGFGGMVVFGVKGGVDEGRKFIKNLKLFSHVANVGDAKSLAIHPASTTHSQLSDDSKESAGVNADLVRLSIGIENIEDIVADLNNALSHI